MEIPIHILNLKKTITDNCSNDTVLSKTGHFKDVMYYIDEVGWNFEVKEEIEKRAKKRLGRYKDFKYDSERMRRILDSLMDDFEKEHVRVFFIGRDMFGGYDDLEEDLVYNCKNDKAEGRRNMPYERVGAYFKERAAMPISVWQQIYGKIALIEVLYEELWFLENYYGTSPHSVRTRLLRD